MYYLIVRQFALMLRNLDGVLGKAQQYAEARKFDVNNFCSARMFPDMLPFVAQVRIACDYAKNTAAALAGREAPRHEDNEQTVADLRARITKCLAYVDAFTEKDFENTKLDTVVPMANRKGKGLRLGEYLLSRQIPNFYFHVTTAYDLLRAGGVEVGKSDFLGQLNFLDLPA
jgi:hypothetical protein